MTTEKKPEQPATEKPPRFPGAKYVQPGDLVAAPYHADPERLALIVTRGADPSDHSVLTINPVFPIHPGEYAIKDYSENAGVLAALVDDGIVAPPHRCMQQGFVVFPLVRLLVDVPRIG
jgi:hypothetical protein